MYIITKQLSTHRDSWESIKTAYFCNNKTADPSQRQSGKYETADFNNNKTADRS